MENQMKFEFVTNPKRMLNEKEAANHCGLSAPSFKRACPVRPVRFPTGDERFDVRDLDGWLDGLKAGNDDSDRILEKLG
jgi:hypothetical protein